jgi:hypothetical protein
MRYILLCVFIFFGAMAKGASLMPAVNQEMSCTTTGQVLAFNGSAIVCQAPSRPVTTVSGLPTCNSGSQGTIYFVTDALAPVALATVAGSGAVKIGVTCNGTNWIVQ